MARALNENYGKVKWCIKYGKPFSTYYNDKNVTWFITYTPLYPFDGSQ